MKREFKRCDNGLHARHDQASRDTRAAIKRPRGQIFGIVLWTRAFYTDRSLARTVIEERELNINQS
jgi:hypothetical protein